MGEVHKQVITSNCSFINLVMDPHGLFTCDSRPSLLIKLSILSVHAFLPALCEGCTQLRGLSYAVVEVVHYYF